MHADRGVVGEVRIIHDKKHKGMTDLQLLQSGDFIPLFHIDQFPKRRGVAEAWLVWHWLAAGALFLGYEEDGVWWSPPITITAILKWQFGPDVFSKRSIGAATRFLQRWFTLFEKTGWLEGRQQVGQYDGSKYGFRFSRAHLKVWQMMPRKSGRKMARHLFRTVTPQLSPLSSTYSTDSNTSKTKTMYSQRGDSFRGDSLTRAAKAVASPILGKLHSPRYEHTKKKTPPHKRNTFPYAVQWYRDMVEKHLDKDPVISKAWLQRRKKVLTKFWPEKRWNEFYRVMEVMIRTWPEWCQKNKQTEAYPPLNWVMSGWWPNWEGWADKHGEVTAHSGNPHSFS